MYNNILFDLDGTLTDPGKGITNSVAYALEKYGIEVKDRTQLYKFIGPPLTESFQKYYGFSPEESEKCVEYYREYFKPKGIFENEIYEGIEEMLIELKSQGKKIFLATSKPEIFAKQILDHFGIMKYFDFVGGATLDGARSKKADVIRYVLENAEITDLAHTVMIGDREQDVKGGKAVGIDTIGVLFGYGDNPELETAGATYIAETVGDIIKYV